MHVNLSLSPGYRLKIERVARMSQIADQVLTALTEERERRHKAEPLVLKAQMHRLEALTRLKEDLTRRLEDAIALLGRHGKRPAAR